MGKSRKSAAGRLLPKPVEASISQPPEDAVFPGVGRRVFLIRHADASEGEKHSAGRRLTPLGRRQAEALARRISNWHVDAIVCSDMNRAQETAVAIHGFHPDIPLIVDATFSEVSREDLEAYERRDPEQQDLFQRLDSAWEKMTTFPYQVTVLVAHTGLMKVLLGKLLKTQALKPRFHCTETGITSIQLRPKWPLLEFFNDTHHLTPELVTPGPKMPWIESESAHSR